MEILLNPEILIALLTLTALEIVLGIDNIIFISILASRLPLNEQKPAQRAGLLVAMIMRVLLLFSLSLIMRLTEPLLIVFSNEISGRDLILIIGGVFLLVKSTLEIYHNVEGDKQHQVGKIKVSFSGVLLQIMVMDLIFSLDSVITAIGLVDQIWIMVVSVVIAVIFMMVFVNAISNFIEEHPSIKILALSFLLLVGLALIGDGLDMHIPKGYIYFSMIFSTYVQLLNIRMKKRKLLIQLIRINKIVFLKIRSLFLFLPIFLFSQITKSNSKLEFTPPLFDEVNVNIDGFLDEEPWSKSLFLSKFTSYLPVDGRPAEDDTQIKIWYSTKALYIGITAWEIHDEVRSTLADRDNLENDDYIFLFLDTYDDQRSAYAFAVNPIGQQGDGIITDRSTSTRSSTLTFNLDDNPDYVFTSKGRLTDRGYVVEIEIPFKSLRYKKSDIQNWGFNVLRRVQHSGYRSTLFNVNLDVASFLAQSGKLVNISGIDRDKIFEISPEFRTSLQRGPAPEKYKSSSNDLLGVNMRYGLSSNIILNGTVNPDFSQIEADVAQINYDPRRSLFFPEKRPFFLDGIELFRTPTRLIYTRKIANPAAAAKIAGKIGNTTVGLISAADNTGPSIAKIDAAYVNAIRLKRDISDQNHIGLVYTDRIHDDWSNRVFALDGKFIAKDKYSFRAQSGFSVTNSNLESGEIAPMWNIAANASGRKWSSSFSTTAYHGDFNPAVGFVERGDYVTISGGPTRRFYGKEDALLEQLSLSYRLTGNWSYDGFISNDKPDDRRMYPSFSMQFKGGWRFTNFTWIEYFGYPEKFYTNYYINSNNEFIPYKGTDELYNVGAMFELTTPQLESFSASFKYGFGRDPNYDEWAPGDIYLIESKIKWNPTDQIRMSLRYNQQQNYRPSDKSLVSESRTPRVKIEYQITPSIFLRGVVQYTSRYRDSLRDNSRTELPVYFKNKDGNYSLSEAVETNSIQADFLFSYRPTPGTLVFLGYGSAMKEPNRFRFETIERQSDGYFLKVSYLFR